MSDTYLVKVMVVDKKTGKGLKGYKVKEYNGSEQETDDSGIANLVCKYSEVFVTVEGSKVYEGYASKAPRPIVVEKG